MSSLLTLSSEYKAELTELRDLVTRFDARTAEAKAQLEHFRQSYAEEVHETDRLEKEVEELREKLIVSNAIASGMSDSAKKAQDEIERWGSDETRSKKTSL